MNDDRVQFEAQKSENILALGQDSEAFQRSIEAFLAADRHRFPYLWSWLGIPIIQMPTDIVTLQEIIWDAKPDVIVETGVARGGSVIFLASLLTLIGKGKVVGVDVDIRAHNRASIEQHPMSSRITLIEGSSVAQSTTERVKAEIPAGATVMVVLDSDHSHAHVLAELEAYGPLVTPGQFLVAADTLLGHLTKDQTPLARSHVWHPGNEPLTAVRDFLTSHPEFEVDPLVNGKQLLASSPGGYLKRIR